MYYMQLYRYEDNMHVAMKETFIYEWNLCVYTIKYPSNSLYSYALNYNGFPDTLQPMKIFSLETFSSCKQRDSCVLSMLIRIILFHRSKKGTSFTYSTRTCSLVDLLCTLRVFNKIFKSFCCIHKILRGMTWLYFWSLISHLML